MRGRAPRRKNSDFSFKIDKLGQVFTGCTRGKVMSAVTVQQQRSIKDLALILLRYLYVLSTVCIPLCIPCVFRTGLDTQCILCIWTPQTVYLTSNKNKNKNKISKCCIHQRHRRGVPRRDFFKIKIRSNLVPFFLSRICMQLLTYLHVLVVQSVA